MRQSDRIIILNTTRYGENSVILHCLSKTYGRCGMMAKGAGRLGAFFQPLNILDCSTTRSPKSSLISASDFSSAVSLNGIRNSYSKNAISIFMAEVLFRSLHEGFLDDGLFDWCAAQIMVLNAMERDFSNFHIRFLMDLSSTLGFKAGFEDLLPYMENSTDVATRMADGDFAEAMLLGMNGEQRTRLCANILKYLENHLETPLHIRSLPILNELFQNSAGIGREE